MEKIRLLICASCPSVEELPDYDGPPQYDQWLNEALKKHRFANGDPHIGLPLANVSVKDWADRSMRDAILEKVWNHSSMPGKGEGFGQAFYDTKDNYLSDAMTCWKGFNRTTNPSHCDYREEKKRLYPDTKADRKEAGMNPKTRPNTFLCDFCPVHAVVTQKQRDKAGLYE